MKIHLYNSDGKLQKELEISKDKEKEMTEFDVNVISYNDKYFLYSEEVSYPSVQIFSFKETSVYKI